MSNTFFTRKNKGFTQYINFNNFRYLSRRKRDSRSYITGFTLIELLVVIAIIGVLASIVLASLNNARRKSRDARRITDIKQLQLALELYFDGQGNQYPTALSALAPTYIPVISADPLGGAYAYAYPSSGTRTTYHVGTSLEDSANPALNGDKDCNSLTGSNCPVAAAYTGGFNGGSATAESTAGCAGEAGRVCYDVVP